MNSSNLVPIKQTLVEMLETQTAFYDIPEHVGFNESQLKLFDFCESYRFLQNELNHIIDSITLARFKILHSSIITPKDLIISLQELSRNSPF